MTSRKGREHVAAEISKEAKQALKEADEPIWKQIDEAVRVMKGLDDVTTEEAFRRRIDTLLQKKKNVQSQIDDLQSELDQLEQEIEDEQNRFDEFLAERDSIQEIQDDVLDDIENTSMSVFARKSRLRELARREYGHETDENIQKAISDLKDRRDELGLQIRDSQFSENVRSSPTAVADGDPQFKALQGDDDD